VGSIARSRSARTILLSLLVAALVASPVAVAARGARKPALPHGRSVDLAPALALDGTFRGAPGVAGTVDGNAWTLVSDLTAGEAPRFAPAAGQVSLSATGPWSALGSNGTGNGAISADVDALAVSGSDLYVGGTFKNAGGDPRADFVAKWNGDAWSGLGSNGSGDGAIHGEVYALAVSGSDLYVGGEFTDVAGIAAADNVAMWNGTTWFALGSNGSGNGALNDYVTVLAASGTTVYVGGNFLVAAGIPEASLIAKWDGIAWSALGSDGFGGRPINGFVTTLAISGTDLYVGGEFVNAGGVEEADDIAIWSGAAWSALGSNGSGNGAITGEVEALAVSGTNVYVGGYFTNAADISRADYLARWNGSSWSALGSNGAGNGALTDAVLALTVLGGDLYVGGQFSDAAGVAAADNIAKWNGSAWSALGSNGSGDGAIEAGYLVNEITVSGTALYVGGFFQNAAGIPSADYVARWGLGSPNEPDGRIRLGTGAFAGNNVYNTSGVNQTRSGSATPGHAISFGISIQNDGTTADRFKVKAAGTAVSGYVVKYFRGTTDITAAVVTGTYQTPSLAPTATYLITAKVRVKSAAAAGSKVTRLVTLTSVGNSAKKDAVKLIGKRA
jgi:hypothetical protein